MSFILDALKKSEAERQRQSGPTLLELRITQPRRRYPTWALWVGVLLALNAAVLLYAVLRRPAPATPAAPALASTASPAAAPAVNAAPALAAARTAPPAASAAAAPALAAATPAAAPAAAASATSSPTSPAVTAVAPLASPSTAAEAAVPPASANPADYEPAVPASSVAATPATAGTGAAGGPAAPVDYSTLPSLASLDNSDIPTLQLNLLVSSEIPGERFALINMHRVHEGDVLPEGPRVLAITRQGVAMDYRGQQFMLRPSGGASP